ncbi:MAG: hypothetical protein IH939_07030 [Acidobacteria bacterium]|nr:hypothetical protein [Acidobacteriota bacterium]
MPTAQPVKTDPLGTTVADLRALALRALARMYRSEHRLFLFAVRHRGAKPVVEGVRRRYTAMTLLGLAGEDESAAPQALGGEDVHALCGRLL